MIYNTLVKAHYRFYIFLILVFPRLTSQQVLKNIFPAPAGVAQLIGASSRNQEIGGSVPGQGTYLGWGLILSPGAQEATNGCFSLVLMFLSLSSSLSLKIK